MVDYYRLCTYSHFLENGSEVFRVTQETLELAVVAVTPLPGGAIMMLAIAAFRARGAARSRPTRGQRRYARASISVSATVATGNDEPPGVASGTRDRRSHRTGGLP
jgi:hypothetical protein